MTTLRIESTPCHEFDMLYFVFTHGIALNKIHSFLLLCEHAQEHGCAKIYEMDEPLTQRNTPSERAVVREMPETPTSHAVGE